MHVSRVSCQGRQCQAAILGAGVNDEAWPHLHHVEVVFAFGLGCGHPPLPLSVIHHLPC